MPAYDLHATGAIIKHQKASPRQEGLGRSLPDGGPYRLALCVLADIAVPR
jgi:hypothetical protein